MWTEVGLYFAGLLVGLAMNFWLDVQLRRPRIAQSIVLVAFLAVVAFLLNRTGTQLDRWALVVVWPIVGLLAGLGAREERASL